MSITNPSRDPATTSSSSQERKSLLTSMLGLGGMGGSAKVTRDDMSSTMLKNSSFADLSFVGGEEESHDHWRDKWTQERRSSNEFKEAQKMAQDVVRQANNPVKLLSSSPAGDSPLTGSLLSGSLPGRHSTGGTRNHAGYSSYPYGPE